MLHRGCQGVRWRHRTCYSSHWLAANPDCGEQCRSGARMPRRLVAAVGAFYTTSQGQRHFMFRLVTSKSPTSLDSRRYVYTKCWALPAQLLSCAGIATSQ
jgi:hypothetical protein